jgi:hypothetical protein
MQMRPISAFANLFINSVFLEHGLNFISGYRLLTAQQLQGGDALKWAGSVKIYGTLALAHYQKPSLRVRKKIKFTSHRSLAPLWGTFTTANLLAPTTTHKGSGLRRIEKFIFLQTLIAKRSWPSARYAKGSERTGELLHQLLHNR